MVLRLSAPFIAFLLAAITAFAPPAMAQQNRAAPAAVGTIAAVVNEDAITVADLQTRLRLSLMSAGLQPTQDNQQRLLPQVLPIMIGHALYFLESNTRSATILGVVGAGGIGLQIAERIRVRHWDEVAFIIILLIIMVAAIDWLSSRLRRKLIG